MEKTITLDEYKAIAQESFAQFVVAGIRSGASIEQITEAAYHAQTMICGLAYSMFGVDPQEFDDEIFGVAEGEEGYTLEDIMASVEGMEN